MLKKKIKLWETEVNSKEMILISTRWHDWAGPGDSISVLVGHGESSGL